MAARVDECFSITNDELRKIYGADFLPEVTYIDHLRQKVMYFTLIKKSTPSKKFKISTN